MGRFQKFYTGQDDSSQQDSQSNPYYFAKQRQTKEMEPAAMNQQATWREAYTKCSSISDYQDYIKNYDSSDNPYIAEATGMMDDLTFFNCESLADFNNYLSSFPAGRHVLNAKNAIRRLKQGLHVVKIPHPSSNSPVNPTSNSQSSSTSGGPTVAPATNRKVSPTRTQSSTAPSKPNVNNDGPAKYVKTAIIAIWSLVTIADIVLTIAGEFPIVVGAGIFIFVLGPVGKWIFG